MVKKKKFKDVLRTGKHRTLIGITFFVNFKRNTHYILGFPSGSGSKESACNAGNLGWEGPLEKEMPTHSSLLAWEIPWTEESGGLAKSWT